MALEPRNTVQGRTVDRSTAAADIDVGLRSYMLSVYNYMALGLAFTGIVAMAVAMNPALMQAIALGPMRWVFFIAIIGMGWFSQRLIMTGSMAVAQGSFWLYAAIWGIGMSPMFYFYTGESIARVFFITAGAFAGLSFYGYTTKRDLAPLGRFFVMAFFGILIAIVVNIFLASTMLHLITAVIAVLFAAGVTAYETQMVKEMYYEGDDAELGKRKAIFGAFALYGAFVMMFVWLLSIFGNRN